MTEETKTHAVEKDPQDAQGAIELPFKAEVQQVLTLVINSLYTHKEVFLRELVSNASDALDKARFFALTKSDVRQPEGEPRISIRLDEEKRTLTIEDNGVGMTKDEVIQNLGTMARSGSAEFLKAYAEAAKSKTEDGLRIIGQFGVGFYAAFMVASRVDVHTLSMEPDATPVIWRSAGSGGFTVLSGDRTHPGTTITLHLTEEEREYASAWRVKEIIKKYSDFVQFPIEVEGEVQNRSSAIWTFRGGKSKKSSAPIFPAITGFDTQTPRLHVHMSVDAPVQFHALLYVPEKAPLDLFSREHRGVRLYAKRILIAEDSDKLTPPYLRFLRGVVDSEDIPLNVSREMLQEDRNLHQIQAQITKSVLRALKELADSEPEKYDQLGTSLGAFSRRGSRPTGSTAMKSPSSAGSSR